MAKKPKRKGTMGRKVKPLNQKKDFDNPAKRDPDQGTLVEIPPKEPEQLVQNDRMKVSYVKPHFDKNKKGNRYVALELSQVVTALHKDLLPDLIIDGWQDITKKNRTRLDLKGIPSQMVKLYMAHDIGEAALEMPVAKVTHVSLQLIEETGTGKAHKVIRLRYRLRVPLSRDVAHFSEWNFGDAYYLVMAEAAGDNLLEDEDEEDEEEERAAAAEA
jgi:hypothetical protein